jgi:hypothetical protein
LLILVLSSFHPEIIHIEIIPRSNPPAFILYPKQIRTDARLRPVAPYQWVIILKGSVVSQVVGYKSIQETDGLTKEYGVTIVPE